MSDRIAKEPTRLFENGEDLFVAVTLYKQVIQETGGDDVIKLGNWLVGKLDEIMGTAVGRQSLRLRRDVLFPEPSVRTV